MQLLTRSLIAILLLIFSVNTVMAAQMKVSMTTVLPSADDVPLTTPCHGDDSDKRHTDVNSGELSCCVIHCSGCLSSHDDFSYSILTDAANTIQATLSRCIPDMAAPFLGAFTRPPIVS